MCAEEGIRVTRRSFTPNREDIKDLWKYKKNAAKEEEEKK